MTQIIFQLFYLEKWECNSQLSGVYSQSGVLRLQKFSASIIREVINHN